MDPIVGNNESPILEVCNVLQKSVSFSIIEGKLFDIAIQLQIPERNRLRDDFVLRKRSSFGVLHEILDIWTSKFSHQARLSVLIRVLKVLGLNLAADELTIHFNLIVGKKPCTLRNVCKVLISSKSIHLLMQRMIDIGVDLQVSPVVLEKINDGVLTQTMNNYQAMYKILKEWKSKLADVARLSALLNVLESHAIHSVAGELRSRFNVASDDKGAVLRSKVNIPQNGNIPRNTSPTFRSSGPVEEHDYDRSKGTITKRLGRSAIPPQYRDTITITVGSNVIQQNLINTAEVAEEILSENNSPAPTNTNKGTVPPSNSAIIPKPKSEQNLNDSAKCRRNEDSAKIVGGITVFESERIARGVYKGKFEKSDDVAVKMILFENISIVKCEIDLLKQSFRHPNIVRLFCTEQDGPFQYIALELCIGTLTNWIEGTPGAIPVEWSLLSIDPIRVLKEATEGLAYLHSLRIVHRDVKPENILLTHGVESRSIKAVIADFGLCKKMYGDMDNFTRSCGGTPGAYVWIAPEIFSWSGNIEDMTNSADVFSLGCVYYYVLSRGGHPYGDRFYRQLNMETQTYNLSKIKGNLLGAQVLVRIMISHKHSARPPLSAVLKHPMFWSKDKVLRFLGNVSNSMESETEVTFPLLKKLEDNAAPVVRNNWCDNICVAVRNELQNSKRPYDGTSIQHLIRAIRNKDNHYKCMNPDVAAVLLPGKWIPYWTGKFPLLVSYMWAGFEELKDQSIFTKYYDHHFKFWLPLVNALPCLDGSKV